ncbi:hypothetical protein [Microbacterium sp. NPDC077486]|uniref:hypothetical protein n=1 Tax=Microbacterium sp. NPDC077486 TaxID=3154766 RepID=UPI003417906B
MVGHGPHVVRGAEFYRGRLIADGRARPMGLPGQCRRRRRRRVDRPAVRIGCWP